MFAFSCIMSSNSKNKKQHRCCRYNCVSFALTWIWILSLLVLFTFFLSFSPCLSLSLDLFPSPSLPLLVCVHFSKTCTLCIDTLRCLFHASTSHVRHNHMAFYHSKCSYVFSTFFLSPHHIRSNMFCHCSDIGLVGVFDLVSSFVGFIFPSHLANNAKWVCIREIQRQLNFPSFLRFVFSLSLSLVKV